MYERLDDAVKFAVDCHAGQIRKLAHTPYILHPMEVASIIATMTADEDVIIAGLLHDTTEDCGLDLQIIEEKFGVRVAALVKSEVEDKRVGQPASETWQQRKEESLQLLAQTKDRNVKILWLADKLSNIRSFYREYKKDGDKIWEWLNQKDPHMQGWYYKTIEALLSELSDTAAFAEYKQLVSKVFGEGE